MKITELIKFLWNGVDIPITRDEIQHSVNVAVWSLKKEISEDEQKQQENLVILLLQKGQELM